MTFANQSKGSLLSDFGGGLELSGVPTLLLSDMSIGATGLGVGSNVGAFLITRSQEPFGLKLRLDRYYSRQEALSRAEATDLAGNSYYKSWSQQYFIISAGAEWREKLSSHVLCYEALLGYALGVHGAVEWTKKDPAVNGGEIHSRGLPVESRFVVMAGLSYKRSIRTDFQLVAGLRSFLPLGTPYGGALEGKAIVPVPLLLSVGLQYR